jgi:SanA protein
MKKIFQSKKFWIIVLVSIIATIYFSNKIIQWTSQDYIYSDISRIPYNKVALVLGTSKKLKSGYDNYYFTYRINAAVALYKAGKIKYIIVSGDNHIADYDEPNDMKQALIAQGIPGNVIYLDYAGFRTYDSVIRCKEIFGEKNVTIISQPFHNERALFIARNRDMNAIAFNAQDVSKGFGFGTQIREKFARVKCVIDLYIIPAKAHFLGNRITIPN